MEKPDSYRVNLFKTRKGYMSGEVAIMLAVLVGWGGATFGFQLLLSLLGDASGESLLTSFTFFNLPFHWWFTGQLLPLWFIILCVLFNIGIDRLTTRHSRRKDGLYD